MSPEPEPEFEEDQPDDTWSLHEVLEHHLARIHRHETRIREADRETERMVERHRAWNEKRTAHSRQAAYQSRLVVEQLMLDTIEADPRAPRSLELPSGRVSTRKGATVVQVNDLDALRDWSYQNNEKVLRWKAEPALDEIRTALADGEAVPGVELVEKPRSVTIRTEGD